MTRKQTTRDFHRRALGALTITRVVRESFPLMAAHDGAASVGALIDEQLARLAAEGAAIETVTLDLEPEQWEELATTIYGGYVEEI